MRIGRARALVLGMTVVMAGALPGAGGAAAGAGPAGFTIECTPTVLGGAPDKDGGVITGAGKGGCVMTGSFGAPWELRVTVRLQAKISGAWRTRGFSTASIESMAATKRIGRVGAGMVCVGSTTRPWRVRVTAEALANEKVVVRLKSRSTISPTASLVC